MTISRTTHASHAAAPRAVAPTTTAERKSESRLGLDMRRFDLQALEVHEGKVYGLNDSVVEITTTTETRTTTVPGRAVLGRGLAEKLGKRAVRDAKKLFDLSPADRAALLRQLKFSNHGTSPEGKTTWSSNFCMNDPDAPDAFQTITWNDRELSIRTALRTPSKLKANGEDLFDETIEVLRVTKQGASTTTTAQKVVGVDVRPPSRFIYLEDVQELLREQGLELPCEV